MKKFNRAVSIAFFISLVVAGCAVFKPVKPPITLQMRLFQSSPNQPWPDAIALAGVRSSVKLQGPELLVQDGATLMRFPGVRWVDSPLVMLSEALQRWRAFAPVNNLPSAQTELTVLLHEFTLELSDQKLSAFVAASAELRCPSQKLLNIALSQHHEPLQEQDPERIAQSFGAATAHVMREIMTSAVALRSHCQEIPDTTP